MKFRQPSGAGPRRASLSPSHLMRLLIAGLSIVGSSATWAANPVQAVDDQFIISNAQSGKDWPSHGLNYQENRFSPLKQIDKGNVKKLGLAWSYDLDAIRGVESTPVVVNGVM